MIICLVLLSVLIYLIIFQGYKDSTIFLGGFLSILILCIVLGGVYIYPDLIGQRHEIISLKQNIKDIRLCRYETEKSNSRLIGGSLDNIKQSTELTQYVKNYAINKARFNRRLIEVKYRKKTILFSIIGASFFVDKKILDIKPID